MSFSHFAFQNKSRNNRNNTTSNSRNNDFVRHTQESPIATIEEDPFLKKIEQFKQPVEYNPILGKLVDTSPRDGISSICYAKDTDEFLFASSFDRHIHIYDTYNKILKLKFATSTPLLDVCGSSRRVFTAGADRKIRIHEIDYLSSNCYGQHEDRITSIDLIENNKSLVSCGLDGQIKIWDSRIRASLTSSADVKRGIFCMDVKRDYIAVGCRQRIIKIYDIRYMNKSIYKIKSNAKGQTKSLKLNTDNDGIVVGTIDGIMYSKLFDTSASENKPHLINAHFFYKEDKGYGFAINAIVALKSGKKYFTGGSDGVINCWTEGRNIPIGVLPSYPTSISSLAINNANNTLAVASSYTWDQLDIEHPVDQIYFRDLNEDDNYYQLGL